MIREKHNVQIWIEDPRNNSTDCRWENMGKWKRLKEAFRLSENLKEYHLGIYLHIGEGERWGSDNPISRYEQNPPG